MSEGFVRSDIIVARLRAEAEQYAQSPGNWFEVSYGYMAEKIRGLADDIDAAVKLERAEWNQRMDEAFRHINDLNRAIGTIQKTPVRKMLLELEGAFTSILAFQNRKNPGGIVRIPSSDGFHYLDRIRAALAAPQRNCDILDEEGAVKAFKDENCDQYENSAEDPRTCCEGRCVECVVRWMLAAASQEATREGGGRNDGNDGNERGARKG